VTVLDRSHPRRRHARAAGGGLLVLMVAGSLAACTGTGGTPAAGSASTTPSGSPATPAPTGPPAATLTPTNPGGAPGTTVTPAPTTGPPGGALYLIGPRDAGRTVEMKVGDRLQVTLTGSRLLPGWALMSYPRAILRLDLRRAAIGQYRFVATAAGQGRVIFVQSGCGGVYERPCVDQLTGAVPTAPVPPVPETRLFVLNVRIR
jgi:hypothetical protein